MKITKNQLKLSKLVSKDASRDVLQSILHDGKKAVVTNGHYLIINTAKSIPVEDIKEPVLLRGKPLQGIKNDCEIIDNGNGSLHITETTGASLPIEKTDGRFPNYQQVIPESTTPFFAVDAKYLKMICDYVIQCTGKRDMANVVFSLQNEPNCEKHSISIDFEDETQSIKSVLMPVRF